MALNGEGVTIKDRDWPVVVSVNIKYCSSVISKNDSIADDLTEIIDHNPLASSMLLKMEISIWTNAI